MVLDVRFLRAATGARIAYTVEGSGPPLVVVPPWTSHLQAQRRLSGHRRFSESVQRHHTVVTYDRWGTGLSDRDRTDFSLLAMTGGRERTLPEGTAFSVVEARVR